MGATIESDTMYLVIGRDILAYQLAVAERVSLQRRLDAAHAELAEYRKLWGDMYGRRSSAG